ncbi:MAG: TOMM precursor leader peptide-binding protein [Cryobacterium sp.]|nr:TOMM precursor leader peptide-binding protein [Cryobacterium sp.]
MTLTLDPRYPLVWRSPSSLQIGVDRPLVVLDDVTIGHERMLAGLAIGLTPPGLRLLGTQSGESHSDIEGFRRAIEPALAKPRASHASSVVVSGSGPTADRLLRRLAEAGLKPRSIGRRPEEITVDIADGPADGHTDGTAEEPAFAIVVAHFVVNPAVRGMWLRRDTPHLPIVFGDTSATLGPIIEPGIGPCLYCLELHRRDADPAWPAIASQLLNSRSPAESPFFASEVAAVAARLTLARVTGAGSVENESITIDEASGAIARRRWQRHPECACIGIDGVSGPVPRGNARVNWLPSVVPSTPPTTTAGASVPA